MVREKTFRQDLFFRLNVIPIRMPPLREHPEDIPVLASYFLEKFCKRTKRRVTGIAPKARDLLCRYEWPGNVRELENAIERAVVMGVTELIVPEDFPEILELIGPELSERPDSLHAILTDAKRRAILRALEQSGGSQAEAAHVLDIHPVHLSKTIKALGLRPHRKASK
jgi:transcriptional regulator with PAS, ATPase and Fis domain